MVSWAVTGATRGIGLGYIDNLSSNPDNKVFAIIRSRETAAPLEKLAAERGNIHLVVTDISSPQKLEQAVKEVSSITAGSLDYLILNAGSASTETGALSPSNL
jgi:NAD(P)-dependent dehydrogenase (short-subunit alcohol dehydrogenase family)